MALRQCPKRLWLEIHRPDLREDSAATQASFSIGFQVGDIARQIYDPDGCGALIDIESEGFSLAFERSKALMQTPQAVFEAGFSANGALAFADVMARMDRLVQDQLSSAGDHRRANQRANLKIGDALCHAEAFVGRSIC